MSQKNLDETTILKKEISKLKREVSRLKKLLIQDLPVKQEIQEQQEPFIETPLVSFCPICKSEKIGSYTTPAGKKITSCKTCKKYREVS